MTTKEIIDKLGNIAGDLVELSMYDLTDNPYDGRGNHPAYAKINQAAELLAEAAQAIHDTRTEAKE